MRGGAASQLTRILYIIPTATQGDGVELNELARRLEVDRKAVVKDLMEVTDRVYYHPAGSGSALQIELTGERVHIWTSGEFSRPMKLSPREALCVGLALRAHEDGRASELLDTLERRVATAEPGELMNHLEPADLRHMDTGIRQRVGAALREKTAVEIRYLKPDDTVPLDRTVHPYALVHAEGYWYLLAYCEVSEGIRNFRMDRILEATDTGRPFEGPADFDPEAFIENGRVFLGGEEMEVRVRYAPAIARWIAERETGQWDEAGGFTVTHRVVDPQWIVRNVLQYGPDAEVLEPEEARAWVLGAVEN